MPRKAKAKAAPPPPPAAEAATQTTAATGQIQAMADANTALDDPDAEAMFALSDEGVMSATEFWKRDDEATFMRLHLVSTGLPEGATSLMVSEYLGPSLQTIAGWDDETVQQVDVWAYSTALSASDNDDVQVPSRPAALDDAATDAEISADEADDDAEAALGEGAAAGAVAAVTGQTVAEVVQQMAEHFAEPPAGSSVLDPRGPSVVHLAALGDMMVNRYGLYLHPGQGYAADLAQSFHTEEIVQDLVRNRAAFLEPTGGQHGSAKITEHGRDLYRAARSLERT